MTLLYLTSKYRNLYDTQSFFDGIKANHDPKDYVLATEFGSYVWHDHTWNFIGDISVRSICRAVHNYVMVERNLEAVHVSPEIRSLCMFMCGMGWTHFDVVEEYTHYMRNFSTFGVYGIDAFILGLKIYSFSL